MTELGYKKRGNRRMASERQLGFTIIELMFTLAVGAVLLAIGIPSFQATIKNNRIVAASNNIAGAIGYARTEAIKRGDTIHVGPGTGNVGIVVWDDGDGDDSWDAGEELRVWPALPANVTVTSGNSRTFYAFRGNGETTMASQDVISVCDDRTGERGNDFTLLISGSVSRASVTCS